MSTNVEESVSTLRSLGCVVSSNGNGWHVVTPFRERRERLVESEGALSELADEVAWVQETLL